MSVSGLGDTIDSILDEIERRLLNDNRMPAQSSGVSISPIDVRQGERFETVIDYPMIFLVHGDVTESRSTTRRNLFTFTVELQIFTADHNPEHGIQDIKDYTLSVRKVFRETADDQHLAEGGDGNALVNEVKTPSYSWGAFQTIGDTDEIEFAGIVRLDIEFREAV